MESGGRASRIFLRSAIATRRWRAGETLLPSRVTASPTTSSQIPLPSGVVLAVEEYGVAGGQPVLFFHGWPSGASQGALLHAAAVELGIRIIAPSRPGVGRSPRQPGRRLLDWPRVVGELADALALDRVRVLGVSGGGPYALAAAWALPERVVAAAVVCGAPPLGESAQGFNFAYRTLLQIYRRHRGLARGFFRLIAPFGRSNPPEFLMRMLRGALVAPDRATLADPAISRMCSDGFREAWIGGGDGVFEDAEIYAQPWGFALEEIRVPVRVWHGSEDSNFAHTLSSYAERIPGAKIRVIEGEGHYSLPILRAREILADLLGAGG
jgi:pimeloyl-ACP methyl ester carboxylesterase